MKLLLSCLAIAILSCGYKTYTPWHENYARHYKMYRQAKCTEAKVETAHKCLMGEGPKAECSLYLMRCTKQNWNPRCMKGCDGWNGG